MARVAGPAAKPAPTPPAQQGVKRREGSSSPCRGGKAAAPASPASMAGAGGTAVTEGDAAPPACSNAGLQFTGLNTQG